MQCVEVGGVDYKSYTEIKKHSQKHARDSCTCTILNIQKMLHLKSTNKIEVMLLLIAFI